jgi:leucine-rich repeat protein SHOC2
LGRNRLSEIPKEIGMLKRLKELRVEENTVKLIPAEIGQCKSLQLLNLHVNSLHGLPVELEYLCDSLEELTLEGNLHLTVLPDEYEHLTTLKRLSLDVELLGSFNNELLSWATTLESLEFDGGKK